VWRRKIILATADGCVAAEINGQRDVRARLST